MMSDYILPHGLAGEQQRLALMSELLDPLERAHIERLGLRPGRRCLEVGCGNGSIAQWLAARVAPTGHVVASDLDIGYIAGLEHPCLEVRQLDILHGPIEEGAYDFVVARAILHHISDPRRALQRMICALKPGGLLLSVEPDMLPCTVTEPEPIRDFWQGWLQWSADAGIDYSIGRKIAAWLDSFGMEQVAGEGHTALFNGGSPWATYWIETLRELRPRLLESGHIAEETFAEFDAHFGDRHYWTSVISFVATWGRKPEGSRYQAEPWRGPALTKLSEVSKNPLGPGAPCTSGAS
ncbi:MAG: class I SAM-dependent methyltransferase [Candidatus Korobacteraceae bacterium]|jgi:SAM-dependent methyltransferase